MIDELVAIINRNPGVPLDTKMDNGITGTVKQILHGTYTHTSVNDATITLGATVNPAKCIVLLHDSITGSVSAALGTNTESGTSSYLAAVYGSIFKSIS